MAMISFPEHLYDPEYSLRYGGIIRACKYLMRLRLELLLEQPDDEVGLRRAMHTCALIEVVHNAYEDNRDGPKADRLFGVFSRTHNQTVLDRLVASKATLHGDELHFADINWWASLDKERATLQLEANLLRMISDEPTLSLMLGIEMQVLLDISMRYRIGSEYPSLVAKYATAKYPILVSLRDRFARLLESPIAA
jgi:hypothetical protein